VSAVSKPATIRSAVVFPQPDGPSSATSSPGPTSSDSLASGGSFGNIEPGIDFVLVDGVDVSLIPAAKRDMGMVFQSYSLFPNMSALDNVGFGLRMRKRRTAERHRRAGELLEMVGLAAHARHFPHQLSGGGQNLWLAGKARPIELPNLVSSGTVNHAAYSALPTAASGTLVFPTQAQLATAETLLSQQWASKI